MAHKLVAASDRRPGSKAGTGPLEIIALKQPFAACGKLRSVIMEPSRIARTAPMPLDKKLADPARRELFSDLPVHGNNISRLNEVFVA
jgi:hypothetical protein